MNYDALNYLEASQRILDAHNQGKPNGAHLRVRVAYSVNAGTFTLTLIRPYPGQLGWTSIGRVTLKKASKSVCISTDLWIEPELRGNGFSLTLFEIERTFVHWLMPECTTLIAFVARANTVQQQRLEDLGWTKAMDYKTDRGIVDEELSPESYADVWKFEVK